MIHDCSKLLNASSGQNDDENDSTHNILCRGSKTPFVVVFVQFHTERACVLAWKCAPTCTREFFIHRSHMFDRRFGRRHSYTQIASAPVFRLSYSEQTGGTFRRSHGQSMTALEVFCQLVHGYRARRVSLRAFLLDQFDSLAASCHDSNTPPRGLTYARNPFSM